MPQLSLALFGGEMLEGHKCQFCKQAFTGGVYIQVDGKWYHYNCYLQLSEIKKERRFDQRTLDPKAD